MAKANNKLNASKGAKILADAISNGMVAGISHVNVAQQYIVITEDRTYRCLSTWKEQIQTKDAWVAPVCLLSSLLFSFVTSTFRDAFGVPKETWQAVALVSIVLSVLWTFRQLCTLIKRLWTDDLAGSIEDLIDRLKKGAAVVHWGSAEQLVGGGPPATDSTAPSQSTFSAGA